LSFFSDPVFGATMVNNSIFFIMGSIKQIQKIKDGVTSLSAAKML
jgi:hypothetical protein